MVGGWETFVCLSIGCSFGTCIWYLVLERLPSFEFNRVAAIIAAHTACTMYTFKHQWNYQFSNAYLILSFQFYYILLPISWGVTETHIFSFYFNKIIESKHMTCWIRIKENKRRILIHVCIGKKGFNARHQPNKFIGPLLFYSNELL